MTSLSTPASPSIASGADAFAATTESPFEHLDVSVLAEIISFVGKNNYYFIAGINRRCQQTYLAIFPNNKYTYLKMKLQHPLRAEQQSCKVFFIDENGDETEIDDVRDEEYIKQLKNDVTTSRILNEASEENPRASINEVALAKLIENASKETCPANRAIRAAQVANINQPDFTAFWNAGKKFLQQVAYSPIAELFCAFSTYYCANKKVMCAHGVYCRENDKNVQRSVSCLPDAALQLTSSFYVIAMMELSCKGTGNPYRRDFFRCKLMTAMSLLAIADYLVDKCKKDRDELDIAIPFIQGSFQGVELYVMRLQGRRCPKIHVISRCKFFDRNIPKRTSEKLKLLSQLAVLLARIVEVTIDHRDDMDLYFKDDLYFRENSDFPSEAIPRNAISYDFEDEGDDDY